MNGKHVILAAVAATLVSRRRSERARAELRREHELVLRQGDPPASTTRARSPCSTSTA